MIKVLVIPAKGSMTLVRITPTRWAFGQLLGGPDIIEANTQGWGRRVGAYRGQQDRRQTFNGRAAALLAMDELGGPAVFFGTNFTGRPTGHEIDVPDLFLRFVAGQFPGTIKPRKKTDQTLGQP